LELFLNSFLLSFFGHLDFFVLVSLYFEWFFLRLCLCWLFLFWFFWRGRRLRFRGFEEVVFLLALVVRVFICRRIVNSWNVVDEIFVFFAAIFFRLRRLRGVGSGFLRLGRRLFLFLFFSRAAFFFPQFCKQFKHLRSK
jgi:hypothetical protein